MDVFLHSNYLSFELVTFGGNLLNEISNTQSQVPKRNRLLCEPFTSVSFSNKLVCF